MEDLGLCPLRSAMAGGTVVRKDYRTGVSCRRIPLRLVQRPHRGEDPQGLRIEGITAPVGNTVIVNRRVRRSRVSQGETLPGGEGIAGKTAAPLSGAGVGVEVGVTAAHRTPVEYALIIWVLFREHSVERDRLARTGAEGPGYAIGQAVGVA